MLDQEIAPARAVAEQQLDLMHSGRIDLAAFGGRFGPLSSRPGMFEGADLLCIMNHRNVSLPTVVTLICGMPDAKRNYPRFVNAERSSAFFWQAIGFLDQQHDPALVPLGYFDLVAGFPDQVRDIDHRQRF